MPTPLPPRDDVRGRGLNEAAGFKPVAIPRDSVEASRQRVGLTRNITNIYRQAPEPTKVAGRQWYPKANDEAETVGRSLRADTRTGAGIIAALSPSMDWADNIPAAHQFVGISDQHMATMAAANENQKAAAARVREHEAVAGKGNAPAHLYQQHEDARRVHMATRRPLAGTPLDKQSTDNIVKASRIRAGEAPEAVLPMKLKTGNFFLNVANPDHKTAVTVDTHAHDAARLSKLPFKTDRGLSAAGRYDHFAGAYRNAAARVGEDTPSAVQATVWQHWKDTYGNKTAPRAEYESEEPTGNDRDKAERAIAARSSATLKKRGRPQDPRAAAEGW